MVLRPRGQPVGAAPQTRGARVNVKTGLVGSLFGALWLTW